MKKQRVSRGVRRTAVVVVGILAAFTFSASPALAANGTMQGTVTATLGGAPIGGVQVHAYGGLYGALYGQTTTAPDGSWSLSLTWGNFRVMFVDPTGVHATVFSGGAATYAGATVVVVPSGGSVVADVAMRPAGTLGGTVTESGSGTTLVGITVQALEPVWGGVVAETVTASGGAYALPIYAGTYRVRFSDPTGAHRDRYSGGSSTWAGSSTVATTVTGTTVVDATMVKSAHIKGIAKRSNGTPVAGITVEVLDLAKAVVGSTTTAADGTYDTTGFGGGTYVVRFSDPTTAFATRYSGNAPSFGTATQIVVAESGTRTVNIGMTVSGHLTGVGRYGGFGDGKAGIYAIVFPAATIEPVSIALTAADGSWDAGGLAPGQYKVGYLDPVALTASPYNAVRPVFVPSLDALTLGVDAAHAAATSFAVSAGGTTSTGDGALAGWDCDPTIFFPGADVSLPLGGWTPVRPGLNLKGCALAGASGFMPPWTGGMIPIVAADLSFADLTGADLQNAPLFFHSILGFPSYTSFGTPITGAKITGANLTGAKLSQAQALATHPDWTGTDLRALLPAVIGGPPFPPNPIFNCSAFDCGVIGGFSPPSGSSWNGEPFLISGMRLFQAMVANLSFVDASGLTCTGCQIGAIWPGWFPGMPLGPTPLDSVNLAGADLTGSSIAAGSTITNANLLGMTGNPTGGAGLIYGNTTCPDGAVTDGTAVLTCVGHGLAA